MVFEKLRAIIADYFEVDEETVTANTTFYELEADEIDMVDVAMSVEDEFFVEVTEEALENFRTVGDIVSYIEDMQ